MSVVGLDNWMYKDRHVDASIRDNNFLSSARVIIYASAPVGGVQEGSYGTFRPIGVIQGYNFSEQRQIELIFEIGSDVPYLIPGRTTGQISLSRMLLYGADLLNVLYDNQETAIADSSRWIKSLKDVTRPLNLIFAAYANTNDQDPSNDVLYSRMFQNCWITGRNESVAAGQTLVIEGCSIMYQQIPEVEFRINS